MNSQRSFRFAWHHFVLAASLLFLSALTPAQTLTNGGRFDILWDVGPGNLNPATLATIADKTYWQVVAGDFHSDPGDELFCYDRNAGVGRIYAMNGAAPVLVSQWTNFSTTWDLVVPGQYDGTGFTDLAFYDRTNRLLQIFRLDPNGALTQLTFFTNQLDWDCILSGNFGGLPTIDDLCFYSKTRGRLEVYMSNGAGALTLQHSRTTSKVYDTVVAGQFDFTPRDDLLFYSQVTGRINTLYMDNNGAFQSLAGFDTHEHWDAIVPVGISPGINTDPRTRLALYDRRSGLYQIGRFNGSNSLSYLTLHNVSKRWTRLLAADIGSTGWLDLIGYDNVLDIHVHAVKCSDDNGGRSNPITASQVQMLVDSATEVYRDAGIEFHFDPAEDFEEVRSTLLNSLDPTGVIGNATVHGQIHGAASAHAATRPGRLNVFFRYGYNTNGATGLGFSSGTMDYVVMPGFVGSTTAYFHDPSNPQQGATVTYRHFLAHELGHFLGLPHTFTGVAYTGGNPHDDVVAHMINNNLQTYEDLDWDLTFPQAGLTCHVNDTPPDVSATYFLNSNWNPGNRYRQIHLVDAGAGINVSFNPDRYNALSYWPLCDDFRRISTDQGRQVREWLRQPNRVSLITSVLGDVERYGTGCGLGILALDLNGRGDPSIGRTFAFDYSGTPGGMFGLLMLGLSATSYNGVALPYSLGPHGAAGCQVYVASIANLGFLTTQNFGSTTWAIPNSSLLVGMHVYSQLAVLAAGANQLGMITSNGLDMTIGADG